MGARVLVHSAYVSVHGSKTFYERHFRAQIGYLRLWDLLMYGALKPFLFSLDAEQAHHLAIRSIATMNAMVPFAKRLRRTMLRDIAPTPIEVAGLQFESPVGLAAGLDKNAEAIVGFFALGFSAVEIGTVTPRPQPGNPRPRLFRIPEREAIINRMGFNNHGADVIAERLKALTWKPGLVGVNVGKNKDTPLEEAERDYVACVERLAPLGDYVVVNLSSPNTPGLRQLQEPQVLERLLQSVRARTAKPVFLKIAPDLADEGVDAAVDVARSCKVDGLICTNTTITRPFEHPIAKEQGGLSGAPVRARATEVVRRAFKRTSGKLPIIGVGGIMSAADAWEKIAAGASVIQLYSGFIYRGPALVRDIHKHVAAKLTELKLTSLKDTVGRDA